ncbi:sensor histidine kinase, partial [Glutamicibacter protophormiae]|uniref:sensor histidine kinase n=1 Tax=Glutamicibacter protophormiae TaxID=37930 RepID=UPI003BB18D00
RIPAAVHTAAHRTVRELLVNHAKHAPGSTLRLSLEQRPGSVQIMASNPVPPHPGNGAGTGVGLASIRTRALAVGGSCEIQSAPEFQVQVTLPTAPRPEEEAHEDPAR